MENTTKYGRLFGLEISDEFPKWLLHRYVTLVAALYLRSKRAQKSSLVHQKGSNLLLVEFKRVQYLEHQP